MVACSRRDSLSTAGWMNEGVREEVVVHSFDGNSAGLALRSASLKRALSNVPGSSGGLLSGSTLKSAAMSTARLLSSSSCKVILKTKVRVSSPSITPMGLDSIFVLVSIREIVSRVPPNLKKASNM